MPEIIPDYIINFLFAMGMIQVIWLSVALIRKGIPSHTIWQSTTPLLAIWAMAWPIYTQAAWLWLPIGLAAIAISITFTRNTRFWQHLRLVWGIPTSHQTFRPWPIFSLLITFCIAIAFFQSIPEFGFGLALSICLAFPLAGLLDRIAYIRLRFPLHPEQTLLGHLGLIIASACLCAWSIHLYHGIQWQQLLIATLIASMGASIIRAMLPSYWNMPIAILTMGWILWLL